MSEANCEPDCQPYRKVDVILETLKFSIGFQNIDGCFEKVELAIILLTDVSDCLCRSLQSSP
jgi:hypothetical protein